MHADPRKTRGMPGSRAPHVWLIRSQERISPHDLFGNFMLFTVPVGDAAWRKAAWRAERIPADPHAALHEALARYLATH